jgi:hypothetical protein
VPSSCSRSPGRSPRLRRVLTLLTATAAALVAVGAVPAPADAAAPSCADVLFVGARGSGQAGPGTPGWVPAPGDPDGFGGPVRAAYDALEFSTGLKHQRVARISTTYPATKAVSPNFLLKIDEYFTGIGTGIDDVDRTLQARAGQCPTERIVLAGYSQGAMVMHRVVARYASSPTRSAILARIDAVVLIGDGDRISGDSTQNFGTMTTGRNGVGLNFRSQSGSSTKRFAPDLGARVLEVCNHNDPVCDSTGRLTDLASTGVHFGYPISLALSDAMTKAGALLRVPPSVPPPTTGAPVQPVFPVMNTSETPPDGVWFRSSPATGDTDHVTSHGVYLNDRVQVQCYALGEAVGSFGNRMWYRVLNTTRPVVPGSGAPNQGYLNTHYIQDGMTANVAAPGIPAC